uniref:Serine protease inhibitor Cvsi-2-like n=1 Tax=Crassostrea virginica TaxID=6565 RepID=A0A8B8DQ02_CRAVI|nr:serine protease inhibitor Cvsi-2-like [Crassostrea virginica]
MKAVLSLILVGFAFVLVYSERCSNSGDCLLETCANSTITCFHGICTCVLSTKCSMLSDCAGLPPCERHGETWHCYDNMCKCLRLH